MFDDQIWTTTDEDLWCIEDGVIWIPFIIRGVLTFVAIKTNYEIDSNYITYSFISKPIKENKNFASNNISHKYVAKSIKYLKTSKI